MSSPPSDPYTKSTIVNPYRKQKQNSHPNSNDNVTNNKSTVSAGPPPAKRLKTPEDDYDHDHTDSATNSLTADEEQALLLANERSEIPSEFQDEMKNTMQKYFAHSSFRPGQLTVLHSILAESKDACVFWATGAGKSLVYQLPPLHLQNHVAIVVSPLISLMQDQCAKLNGRGSGDSDIATYLGSSQSDPRAEEKALNGEYKIVYVTPEKLTTYGFNDKLAYMHQHVSKICLIAIDESHCVSEWGHDFRPTFLQIGPTVRSHHILCNIPLVALTATAVPRVQEDIIKNLQLRQGTTIAKKSFDRSNLKITIRRKPITGNYAVFDELVQDIAVAFLKLGNKAYTQGKSTIVYCATKKEVEEICGKITQALAHKITDSNQTIAFSDAVAISSNFVKPYHAGLSIGNREDAHTNFLIGKVSIIVATVAFGMGIDKPDIRRVIHWGPCKTVEEYYQQMGRAGRDGLSAECTMYANLSEFSKFKGEFYIGSLQGEAKEAIIRSMDALKDFAMSTDGCRRASLLEFFGEKPSFGTSCGTCDLCRQKKQHANDFERDFQSEGARVILLAIAACPEQPMSTFEKIINGGTVEDYRYYNKSPEFPSSVTRKVKSARSLMAKKKPLSYFKELFQPLTQRGFIKQSTRQSTHKYAKPYVVYSLTLKGQAAMTKGEIILPVPTSVRELEKAEAEKRRQALADLKSKGVDLEQIPDEELHCGEGECITALKIWYNYIDSLGNRGKSDLVNELDDLKSRIEAWRMDMAERYRMAPAAVLEEHLLLKIAYAAATCNNKMDKEALIAAGVRSNGIDELTSVLGDWVDENAKASAKGDGEPDDAPMTFTVGESVQASKPWRHAVYKPNKKTGKAVWEVSYDQFVTGTHPQTIAMTQASGRPIQVATVVGHLLDALEQGRTVDLHRLSSALPPPTKSEWEQLARCEVETCINVTDDPATASGGERFTMANFLLPIMGADFASKEYKQRTPEESEKFSKWCKLLKYYLAFRRAGVEPSFGI
ncbi:hypothetical protein ACHAWT_005759 [Skeletonema menzelii]